MTGDHLPPSGKQGQGCRSLPEAVESSKVQRPLDSRLLAERLVTKVFPLPRFIQRRQSEAGTEKYTRRKSLIAQDT